MYAAIMIVGRARISQVQTAAHASNFKAEYDEHHEWRSSLHTGTGPNHAVYIHVTTRYVAILNTFGKALTQIIVPTWSQRVDQLTREERIIHKQGSHKHRSRIYVRAIENLVKLWQQNLE